MNTITKNAIRSIKSDLSRINTALADVLLGEEEENETLELGTAARDESDATIETIEQVLETLEEVDQMIQPMLTTEQDVSH